MALVNPRGFVPTRTLSGGNTSFRTGPKRPTLGGNRNPIYPGDLVYMDSGGQIQRALVATVAGQLMLGVVQAVYAKNLRPRTFAQPNAAAFIAASTTGFASVFEDPNIIYTVNCSASIGNSDIGKFANVVISQVANTAAGISGMCLDGVDVTATSEGHPLKIFAISSNETFNEVPVGGANQDVEVLIVNHLWTNAQRKSSVIPT